MSKPKRLDVTRWAAVWPTGSLEVVPTREAARDVRDWYSSGGSEPRICKVRITEIVPTKKAKKERAK